VHAGCDRLAHIGKERRCTGGIGHAFPGHDRDAALALPDVLKDHGRANFQAEQHAGRKAGHVAERRANEHCVACVEAKSSGKPDAAAHQRIQAMHDALGRARRA